MGRFLLARKDDALYCVGAKVRHDSNESRVRPNPSTLRRSPPGILIRWGTPMVSQGEELTSFHSLGIPPGKALPAGRALKLPPGSPGPGKRVPVVPAACVIFFASEPISASPTFFIAKFNISPSDAHEILRRGSNYASSRVALESHVLRAARECLEALMSCLQYPGEDRSPWKVDVTRKTRRPFTWIGSQDGPRGTGWPIYCSLEIILVGEARIQLDMAATCNDARVFVREQENDIASRKRISSRRT
uniref:Uncharacterized protein n=1 Tax=Steinernema glaseri TaxID=37863 RepID=A0A1I7Y7L4_9BILA